MECSNWKFILGKLNGASKNPWVNPFPDRVCHFGAHWRTFWILQVVWHCRWWVSASGAGILQVLRFKCVSSLMYELLQNIFIVLFSNRKTNQRFDPMFSFAGTVNRQWSSRNSSVTPQVQPSIVNNVTLCHSVLLCVTLCYSESLFVTLYHFVLLCVTLSYSV